MNFYDEEDIFTALGIKDEWEDDDDDSTEVYTATAQVPLTTLCQRNAKQCHDIAELFGGVAKHFSSVSTGGCLQAAILT